MTKKQKEYWENIVVNMDPDNQLELARVLIKELHLNEDSLNENEYDMSLSIKLRSTLEEYAKQETNKIEGEKLLNILDRFIGLTLGNQKKIIDSVVPCFLSVMEEVIKNDKILHCSKEGHAYGDNSWKRNEWTTRETTYIDHQKVPDYPIEHVNWTRQCPNCGFIEETDIEPLEAQKQREGTEKQARIKELKSELRDLRKDK